MPDTFPTLYSTNQAALRLSLQPQTLRKWRVQGRGPRYFRLGVSNRARVVYADEDILAWLSRRAFGSTAEETVAALEHRLPGRQPPHGTPGG